MDRFTLFRDRGEKGCFSVSGTRDDCYVRRGRSCPHVGVTLKTIAASLVALLAVVGSANASSWEFELENRSPADVTLFRTFEDGQWSQNWLKNRIKPQETYDMDFGTDSGDCVVRTQITFSDQSYFDSKVDYCEVSKLIIFSDRVEWE